VINDKEKKTDNVGYVPQGTSNMQAAVAGLDITVGENGVLKTSDGTIIGSMVQGSDGKWGAMVQPQYASAVGATGNGKGDQSLVAVGLDKLNIKASSQTSEIYKAAISQAQKKNQDATGAVQSDKKKDQDNGQTADQKQTPGAVQGTEDTSAKSGQATTKKSSEEAVKKNQVNEQSLSEKKSQMWQLLNKKPGDAADVAYVTLGQVQETAQAEGIALAGVNAGLDTLQTGEQAIACFAPANGNGKNIFVAVRDGMATFADASGNLNVVPLTKDDKGQYSITVNGETFTYNGTMLATGKNRTEDPAVNKNTQGLFVASELTVVNPVNATVTPQSQQDAVNALSSLFNSILKGLKLSDDQNNLLTKLGLTIEGIKNLGAEYLNNAVAYLQSIINNGGTIFNCAVESLNAVLTGVSKGVLAFQAFLVDIATGNFLKNQTTPGVVNSSMLAIQRTAAANGMNLDGYATDIAGLLKAIEGGKGAVVQLDLGNGNGHFVTITGIKDGIVNYTDSDGKNKTMTMAEFQKLWSGKVLSQNKLSGENVKNLDAQSLMKVIGAGWVVEEYVAKEAWTETVHHADTSHTEERSRTVTSTDPLTGLQSSHEEKYTVTIVDHHPDTYIQHPAVMGQRNVWVETADEKAEREQAEKDAAIEQARIAAEEARIAAEKTRIAAEQERQKTEEATQAAQEKLKADEAKLAADAKKLADDAKILADKLAAAALKAVEAERNAKLTAAEDPENKDKQTAADNLRFV
ncbi:MAG: cysteine peptidase family C39 domain-containing protein, partial [Elusimicrobiota bacterium]